MIECETKIDGKVQKEILKSSLITALVFLIIGAIGTVAYLVLASIFDNSWFDILLIFAFLFGFGLIFYITLNKTIKTAEQTSYTNKYQFNEEVLTITSFKDGQEISTATSKYELFIKIKETKNLVLMYPTKTAIYPILKSNLTEQDLTEIRKLLKLNTQENKK